MNPVPLFPLNIVLFPDGALPLRIFETRYLDMVRDCMREGHGFGVVLIRKGNEAGVAEMPAQSSRLIQTESAEGSSVFQNPSS